MIVLQIIFWFCAALMVYSYLIYPLVLEIISLNKKENTLMFSKTEELPVVCVLMSVFNEERIIEKKLQSLVIQQYPADKLFFLIGSDCSTDATEGIIKSYAIQSNKLLLFNFNSRQGKPTVINQLAELAKQYKPDILLLTDANVIFKEDTVFELVKQFKNTEIGLVGANIINSHSQTGGIAKQEKIYIKGENRVKYLEGLNWGTMMGAFGGAYAVRENLFKPVKARFSVDDFFITISVLRLRSKAISDTSAICYEDVSEEIKEEFRRKKRIATGNFQNLSEFGSFILNPFSTVGFCFISHKLIRWLGPLFIVTLFVSSAVLAIGNKFYLLLFTIQLFLLLTPVIDYAFKKVNLHINLLRFVAYFYMMNVAVLAGFINYLKGIDSNAWTPTKRNT